MALIFCLFSLAMCQVVFGKTTPFPMDMIDPGFNIKPIKDIPTCLVTKKDDRVDVFCFGLKTGGPTLDDMLTQAKEDQDDNTTINVHDFASKVRSIEIAADNIHIMNTTLSNFTKLDRLEMRNGLVENVSCTIESGAFENLISLTQLSFSGVELPDNFEKVVEPVSSTVEMLSFYQVNMKDRMNAFRNFTNLKEVKVIESDLDQFPAAELRNSASTLNKIDLAHNQIKSIKSDQLRDFVKLVILVLNFNQIDSIDQDAFKDLKKLGQLYIAANKITDLSPDMFKSNSELYVLDMSGNPTSGLKREDFEFLKDMASLDLPNKS